MKSHYEEGRRCCFEKLEDKKGKTFADYHDEFEYLISAGIALHVQAISNPAFPLADSTGKNLLKLYLNDVEDYHIQKAFVVSNERTVSTKGKIIYIPVYYIMFFQNGLEDSEAMQF